VTVAKPVKLCYDRITREQGATRLSIPFKTDLSPGDGDLWYRETGEGRYTSVDASGGVFEVAPKVGAIPIELIFKETRSCRFFRSNQLALRTKSQAGSVTYSSTNVVNVSDQGVASTKMATDQKSANLPSSVEQEDVRWSSLFDPCPSSGIGPNESERLSLTSDAHRKVHLAIAVGATLKIGRLPPKIQGARGSDWPLGWPVSQIESRYSNTKELERALDSDPETAKHALRTCRAWMPREALFLSLKENGLPAIRLPDLPSGQEHALKCALSPGGSADRYTVEISCCGHCDSLEICEEYLSEGGVPQPWFWTSRLAQGEEDRYYIWLPWNDYLLAQMNGSGADIPDSGMSWFVESGRIYCTFQGRVLPEGVRV
jgi:hypothetical protein